ncbi:MAG: hypothetical protein ACE5FU_10440, partial [Nitrospinota bacterium]
MKKCVLLRLIFGVAILALPMKALALPVSGNIYFPADASDPTTSAADDGQIYMTDTSGNVSVVVSSSSIRSATGREDVRFSDNDLTFDTAGNMYFTESESDGVLKFDTAGNVTVLATEADIGAITGRSSSSPEGIVFGSDGFLYVSDDTAQAVVKIDPSSGNVSLGTSKSGFEALAGISTADMEAGIDAVDGKIFALSDGSPDTVFEIDIATGLPSVLASDIRFDDIEKFMTIAPNGDLIIADEGGLDELFRVTQSGVTSLFLTNQQIKDVMGRSVIDLEAGLTFDLNGNFYLGEENGDDIYMWQADSTPGSIIASSGSVFLSDTDIEGAFGLARVDLQAGFTVYDTPAQS